MKADPMRPTCLIRYGCSFAAFWLLTSTPVFSGEIRISEATVQLLQECRIPARVSGQVTMISTKEGETIKQGQIIAVLENRQQELAVQHAELKANIAALMSKSRLNLQAAQARIEATQAAKQVRIVALDVAKKEAKDDVAIAIAEAETKLRQLERQRAESARKTYERSVSESQLDRLKTDEQRWKLEIAKASTEQAVRKLKPQAEQAAIEQAEKEITQSQLALQVEEQNQMVAKVNEQIEKNAVQSALWDLELRNIRSPISGTVAGMECQPGEWVEAGSTVIRVINLAKLRAEGLMPAANASQKLVGQPVKIRFNDQTIVGKVSYVGHEIDPIDQLVSIYVEFENTGGSVLPGTIAELLIETE